MRYDVLIVSNEQKQFKDFKRYASKIMKNVNITLSLLSVIISMMPWNTRIY